MTTARTLSFTAANERLPVPPVRAELESTLPPLDAQAVVERPRSLADRLWQQAVVRQGVLVAALALLWEVIARLADNELLLPTFGQTARELLAGIASGELVEKAGIPSGC